MHNHHFSVSFDNQVRTIEHLSHLIDRASEKGAKGITLFLGEEYLQNLKPLGKYLETLDISVSGAIFPEVIFHDKYYKDAAVVAAWNTPIQVKTFLDISNTESELYTPSSFVEKPVDVEGCLLFVDAKTHSLESALDALYYRNEFDFKYAGGGAGYIEGQSQPCIFTNNGIVKDALQTVSLPFDQKNALCHGWSVLSGPHMVTQATGNRVKTLDYLPIKQQYSKFIQSKIDEDISNKSIDDLLLHYPIGIQHYGEEIIVRDPYRYKNGWMEFMGDVPEFSNIYILSGKPESLLTYVEDSFNQQETNNINEGRPDKNLSILFSCVGRRAHMGDVSDDELALVSKTLKQSESIIGTASLGEFVTNQAGLLRLHNMSLVTSRLY